MPKKGEKQPWKVRFQYSGMTPASRSHFGLWDAANQLRDLRQRGAAASVWYKGADGLHELDDKLVILGLRALHEGLCDELANELETTGFAPRKEEDDSE
jgi:hypothetical protein